MYPDTELRLKSLLYKHLNGTITDGESFLLGLTLSQAGYKHALTELLTRELESAVSSPAEACTPDSDRIYEGIIRKISRRRKIVLIKRDIISHSFKRTAGWAAAAAILFLTLFIFRKTSTEENIISESISDYEIRTPYGALTNITLLDGTAVILNAGSVIKYGPSYNSDQRNITLNGEAYFKVARNDSVPFIVRAGNIDVLAKGTEFNLKAYSDDDFIEATLVEGRIEVLSHDSVSGEIHSVELLPLQKAFYKKRIDSLEINNSSAGAENHHRVPGEIDIDSKVDVNQVTAWTRELLIIDNEPIGDLVTKLERKYDVEIHFADEQTKKIRFTGTLENEPIEQVLAAIKLSAPVDYSISGKSIIIYTDKINSSQE